MRTNIKFKTLCVDWLQNSVDT